MFWWNYRRRRVASNSTNMLSLLMQIMLHNVTSVIVMLNVDQVRGQSCWSLIHTSSCCSCFLKTAVLKSVNSFVDVDSWLVVTGVTMAADVDCCEEVYSLTVGDWLYWRSLSAAKVLVAGVGNFCDDCFVFFNNCVR